MDRKPGCLSGILKLVLLDQVFDWLQERFGFKRGCSCSGCGCGFILLVISIIFAISIITGTDWTSFSF